LPFSVWQPAKSGERQAGSSAGTITVTPVRTSAPCTTVVWPTRTPATSVIAFSGPGCPRSARPGTSRALTLATLLRGSTVGASAQAAALRRPGTQDRTPLLALIAQAGQIRRMRDNVDPIRSDAATLDLTPMAGVREPLYRERPRCPFWVYLGFFFVPVGVGAILLTLFHVVDPNGDYLSGALVVLVSATILGALPALSQRPVTVDSESLSVGRYKIPIHEIASMRPVAGMELKRVRHQIADPGPAWVGLMGFGPLSSGFAMMFAGVSLMRSEKGRRGMLCSPWQEPALVVETPALPTKRWLISSSDPARLEQVIAQSSFATPSL
jgi:hypothetical protein